jgi:NAD(P)-dependent dehydrogenase (short-subunit alcohol dehydrogenase family)
MVNIARIRQCNAQIDDSSAPHVAVFVGGTSGIGKITLAEIVGLGSQLKAYVVGRKETEAAFRPFLDELRAKNPKADLVWVEGQASLLSDVRRICADIKSREQKVDFLCLTAGYPPFGGRNSMYSVMGMLIGN